MSDQAEFFLVGLMTLENGIRFLLTCFENLFYFGLFWDTLHSPSMSYETGMITRTSMSASLVIEIVMAAVTNQYIIQIGPQSQIDWKRFCGLV